MARRRKKERGFHAELTGVVAVMQIVVVVAFLVDPWDPPAAKSIWAAIGALSHQVAFGPLITLLIAGPTITWLAWSQNGRHRSWLVVSWTVFSAVIAGFFAHRFWVMTQLVWKHGFSGH